MDLIKPLKLILVSVVKLCVFVNHILKFYINEMLFKVLTIINIELMIDYEFLFDRR